RSRQGEATRQRYLVVLVFRVVEQTDRTSFSLEIAGLAISHQNGQRQMPADAVGQGLELLVNDAAEHGDVLAQPATDQTAVDVIHHRSEEHTSELQSRENLVC